MSPKSLHELLLRRHPRQIQEVLEQRLAVLRGHRLRVELHPEDRESAVPHGHDFLAGRPVGRPGGYLQLGRKPGGRDHQGWNAEQLAETFGPGGPPIGRAIHDASPGEESLIAREVGRDHQAEEAKPRCSETGPGHTAIRRAIHATVCHRGLGRQDRPVAGEGGRDRQYHPPIPEELRRTRVQVAPPSGER